MNKEERYGILYKDEKGYRHFNNIKCSTRLNYKGDDIIPLWEFAESLQSQLDIANNKLKEIKEYCIVKNGYESNEVIGGHNSFDHFRIIESNNKILSIIGSD